MHARTDQTVLRQIMAEGEAILPVLAGQEVTAAFAGLRPATEHRDYQLSVEGRMSARMKAGYACRCGAPRCRGTMLEKKKNPKR